MWDSAWFNSLKKWLLPPVDGDIQNRRAVSAHIISLAIIVAATIAIFTEAIDGNITDSGMPLLAGIILAGFAFWLNTRRHTNAAGILLVTSLLGILTWLLVAGQGIHDIAIILYPAIMIVISLLFEIRTTLLGYLLVTLSVGLVIFGELNGLYDPRLNLLVTRPVDFILVTVILAVIGIGLNLINLFLNKSLENTRKNAQALKISEARFRSLAENAPDLTLSIDRKGVIQFANRPDRNQQSYIGRNINQYLQSEQTGQFASLLQNTFETGEPASLEIQLVNHSGALNWYSCRFGPIWQDGKFDQIVFIVTDIDKRKQIEADLQHRTEQLSTLNQIATTISSLQSQESLLRLILDQLQQAISLDCFFVGLYDPKSDLVSFPLMYDDGKFWEESETNVKPDSLIGRCIYQEKEYLLNRTQEELDTFELKDMLGEKSKASASLMLYPLYMDGQCMGVVSAQSYAMNAYTQDHLDFLGGAAAHITVAIQNARLYEDLKRRSEQLGTLNQIAAAVTSQQELDAIFELTFDLLKSNLPLDVFYVALYDQEADLVSYPILYDGGKRWQEDSGKLSKVSWILEVISTSQPLLVKRTQAEIDERAAATNRSLGDRQRVSASIMMVPLRIAGKNIGAVSVQSYELNTYADRDLDFLSGAANYIAIAIQNARLIKGLESELEEGRRSSNALRQSEARLRAVIENIPYDMWMVDSDLRYMIQSSVSNQVSGNIIGKSLDELDLSHEVRRTLNRLYRQARQGKVILDEGEWRVNDQLRTFLTMVAPVKDVENLLGYVGMNIDITDLKHSEERLRQYAARIEILHEIDQAILAVRSPQEIAVATLSRLPRIVPCSSASLALLNVEELTADVIAIYSDNEVHPGAGKIPFQDPERLEQLVEGHIVYITDLVTQPLEGPPSLNRVLLQGPIHAVIAVPLLHQDRLVGVLSVGAAQRGQLSREDVQITQEIATQLAISIYQAQLTDAIQIINTELEQRVLDRTAQLEAAYLELEAFSYSVSHDLRAPLRGITGYLNFFMEDYGACIEQEGQEYLQRIQGSAKRMNELIDDLLSLSRVGRQKLELTTFSLGELVQLVLSEMLAGQDKERIQITTNPLPRVTADRGLLRQVFQNLIDNALKYSSNQTLSQIEIGSLVKDNKTTIYIRDNGVGFDMKFANKLFTPFERLHSRDEYEGTGIGLATVKRILTRHDGQIWVESAPGEGTTFYFTMGT